MAEDQETGHIAPRYTAIVTETPKFDLTSYISNYHGRTVFRRLYLIASCSTVLREEAARLAIAEAKRSPDIPNYRNACALIGEPVDSTWVNQQEKKNNAEVKRLENELKQYKNNLIRESIRMGSEDLGAQYHALGELGNAIKAYSRMRDYCTAPAHIAATAFRIIAVVIEQKQWLSVQSQVTKVRSLQTKPEEAARYQPKIMAAQGLSHMAAGEFKEAANAFVGVESTLGDTYADTITPNDVAVYGGLCALASMSRSELQTRVLDNNNFRSFLELEPHIRRAINSFVASKYSQCLEIVDSYRADYLLDIYLQDQYYNIYQKIRTKSIVQYFQPFSRVTLDSMEAMFGASSVLPSWQQPQTTTNRTSPQPTSTPSPQQTPFVAELIHMITTKQIAARIDLENSVLIAHQADKRAEMQKQALDTIDDFISEAQVKLLRLNALNGGLE
ncbi:hypothetical protein LTR66_017458, partial [Elasticomyces elasticus]